MSSIDDHVCQIFQQMSVYSRFFIFLQFDEGLSSQFIIE